MKITIVMNKSEQRSITNFANILDPRHASEKMLDFSKESGKWGSCTMTTDETMDKIIECNLNPSMVKEYVNFFCDVAEKSMGLVNMIKPMISEIGSKCKKLAKKYTDDEATSLAKRMMERNQYGFYAIITNKEWVDITPESKKLLNVNHSTRIESMSDLQSALREERTEDIRFFNIEAEAVTELSMADMLTVVNDNLFGIGNHDGE